MSLRGEAAIVGFGELPSVRFTPGRTPISLVAEACNIAIRDAGLRKEDVDGLISRGEEINAMTLAEYLQLKPMFCEGVTLHGASGAFSIQLASMAVSAGLANYVLCSFGGGRDLSVGGFGPAEARARQPAGVSTEWEVPYGPVIAANGGYGLIKQRHMFQYGTKDEQFAKISVNQRFNALTNPNAAFKGQPITLQDVLNSRYINDPLHMLESVMPCAGAGAVIVTTPERARAMANPPVYLLGAGGGATTHDTIWMKPGDITYTPVVYSAPKAYKMAGYGPKDIEFAEFYD